MKDIIKLVEELQSRADQTGTDKLTGLPDTIEFLSEEELGGVLVDALTLMDLVLEEHNTTPSTRDRTLRLMIDVALHGIRHGFDNGSLRASLGEFIAAGYREV